MKTCFSFLRVKHEKLIYYQWIVPIVVSLLMTIAFVYLPIKPRVFGQNGLVLGINSLLGILIGFYIASIAAISTFSKPSLDEHMSGTPPKLQVLRDGEVRIESLTRRRFLCIIFGYCACISVVVYMLGLFTSILLPSLYSLFLVPCFIKYIWLFIYFFFILSLGCVTFIGLHYLIDRIHR